MVSRTRKHTWTAQLVPFGTLRVNPSHPHFKKDQQQRLNLAIATMKQALLNTVHGPPIVESDHKLDSETQHNSDEAVGTKRSHKWMAKGTANEETITS